MFIKKNIRPSKIQALAGKERDKTPNSDRLAVVLVKKPNLTQKIVLCLKVDGFLMEKINSQVFPVIHVIILP